MTAYVTRRLIQTLILILLLSVVCFYLMSLMPGDPVDIMISSNPEITIEDIDRLKKLYGLDLPIHERYVNWVKDTLSGDLGYSRQYQVPVTMLLAPRLINTFYLSMGALVLALSIALPLGMLAALKSGSKIDYSINLLAFAGMSIPSFFLGILLILLFAVHLRWFPAGGTETVGGEKLTGWFYFWDRLRYIILPMLSLAAMQMAVFVRYTRSSMIETMRMEFIRTARAKGLGRWRVVLCHGLRNALIPIVTVIALSFSALFSGAIITETLFSYQGVGKLVYDAIIANDFRLAMVSFMITVGMVLIMNLVVDLVYAFLDPRISYQ